MRAAVYAVAAGLMALNLLLWLVGLALSALHVAPGALPWLPIFGMFTSLVPPIAAALVPPPLRLALAIVLQLLIVRRLWLFAARGQRVPRSFGRMAQALATIGCCSLLLGLAGFLLSARIGGISAALAALALVPATICIPWAFFLTELASLLGRPAPAATHIDREDHA